MALTNFNKTISWNDFNKVPARPPGKSEDAVISATWDIDVPEFAMKGNAIVLGKYTVNVFLVKEKCNVVTDIATGSKSAELLKHEQGHFDIVALGAREFHTKAAGLSAATEDELNAKLKKLREDMTDKTDAVDERYDKATNHSINTDVQQIWNTKINAAKLNPRGTVSDLPL